MINQGLVDANVNGDALSLATSAMTNSALMEATAGGVLSVSTTVNNASGTILAAPGSLVQVSNGGLLDGGTVLAGNGIVQTSGGTIANATLISTGSGSFQGSSNNGNLSGSTLSTGSQLNISYNQTVTISNGLTNNGTINVGSTYGYQAFLMFSGSQTLSGTGSVVLNAVYAPQYAQLNTLGGSDVLIQAAGHTISGFGQINAGLINQGLVNANVHGDALSLATRRNDNSALMEATAGGVLSVSATSQRGRHDPGRPRQPRPGRRRRPA